MRYSYCGSIDTVSNKYGYEYIRVAALKQAVLPLLMSLTYFFLSFDNLLLFIFIGIFTLVLATLIIHGINSHKLSVKGSMIFLGAYTLIAQELYRLAFVMLEINIFDFNKISIPLFVFNIIFSIVITVNFIVLLVNLIRSFRYEAIKRKTRNCRLDIYDEKIIGVALDVNNREVDFQLSLWEIKDACTVERNLKRKQLCNFVLLAKNGTEYKIALSSNISAREEIKYIIKEIEKGNKPYPKKACEKCGFYLIDERCPNCQKPTT